MSCTGGCDRSDGPTVVRLLRETIVQLCRTNAPFGGGRVEIDGIICITGSGSGQQLVVKVHEVIHDAVDRSSGPPYPGGLFDRDRYLPSVDDHASVPDLGVDIKRRRMDMTTSSSSLDSLPPVLHLLPSALRPPPSALYDYLSRFGLPSSPRASAADFDGRFAVKDLSLKPRVATSATVDSTSDGRTSPLRRPVSPADGAVRAGVLPPYTDRWSPSRRIPAIPQCFVCGYRFSSAEALGEHNETVHSIFTCLCCFKTFTSRSNLERHSRLHTGHRPYACPVCGKTFSRKDHLSNHATKHAYKCGTCTRRCSDQPALAEHYRSEHPGLALAAVCAYCNKGFSSVELYEEHVKVHPQFHVTAAGNGDDQTTGPVPLVRHQCQMCGFEAMDRVCLVQHQQLMHYTPMSLLRDAADKSPMMLQQRVDQQIYRCVVCGFTTGTLLTLRQHEAAHVFDMSSRRLSSYDQCAARRSPSAENRDRELICTEGHGCQHCRQQFGTYASLCQHLSTCGPSEEVLLTSQHRDKRKQKQPKPTMAAESDNEDEEVNVVSPGDMKSGQEAVEIPVHEIRHNSDGPSSPPIEDGPREIRMKPIRSIMNRASLLLTRVRDHHGVSGTPSPPPLQDECVTTPDTGFNDVTPPQLLKRESSAGGSDWRSTLHDISNNGNAELTCENSPSRHSSMDDLAVHSNNNEDCKEGDGVMNPWTSSSLAEQTRCAVCGTDCSDFTEMEAHCLTEHSRSPCMYCSKTFAQKANRDRHMCLHTGDRPYGCPECGERFSRGDKLKMHRVRTHGVQYPLYGSRGGQRDRDGAASSSQNHSTSQSPMMYDCSDSGAMLNGGNGLPVNDSDLHGSTSVMSAGEWIDLRISMCHREPSKLQSALAGITPPTNQPLDTFPKREVTDEEVAGSIHGNM